MENIDVKKVISGKQEKLTQKCSGISKDVSNPEREKYLKVMANFVDFYRSKPAPDEESFRNLMFYRELAEFFQFNFCTDQINAIKGTFPKEPVIYVSYHMGAYRSINHLLHFNNINYCLAISKLVMDNQNSDYQHLHHTLVNNGTSTSDFQVLDVENSSSLLHLIRYVKQGYSLLFYLDGNSGIGGMARNDEKLITVDFFNKRILSRKGIGFLSHFLKIPVVPIISYFEPDFKMAFDILDPIYPLLEKSREVSTSNSTQILWKILEQYLRQYPEQWECWLYLNTYKYNEPKAELIKAEVDNTSIIRFNSDRYDFYKLENYFLFDKLTISSYKLQDVLFRFLSALRNHSRGIKVEEINTLFPKTLFNQLVQTQVLIQ